MQHLFLRLLRSPSPPPIYIFPLLVNEESLIFRVQNIEMLYFPMWWLIFANSTRLGYLGDTYLGVWLSEFPEFYLLRKEDPLLVWVVVLV